MVDIPNGTSTTVNLSIGGSYAGSLEVAGDRDWVRVSLQEGHTYSFSLSGDATLTDTYLRIYDRRGNLLSYDDDSGVGNYALAGFSAALSGEYYIEAASFNNGSAGSYTLSATDVTSQVSSMDAIADQLVNGYWTSDGSSAHRFNVSSGGSLTYNLVALTAEGQTLARAALATWTEMTGVNFVETTATARITFDDSQAGAYSNSSWSGSFITSSTVNISTDWLTSYGTSFNSYGFQTYIHEIGHALGLGHAGNYNNTANYPTDALFANDSWQASIMSYFNPLTNTMVDGDHAYLVSPMLADIIAIQSMYGSASGVRAGATTYGFNANAGAFYDATAYPNVQYTIYDTGGVDTLDFSGFADNQTIDLRAESRSSVGGLRGNVGISRGVTIENAIGGAGNDTLIGNGVGNILNGGAGADLMVGLGGDDVYVVNVAGDIVQEVLDAGYDSIRSVGSYSLAQGLSVERLSVFDAASTTSVSLGGNAFAQTLLGNAGANVLNGRGGADAMYGYGGADIYIVDNAGDVCAEAAGGGADAVRTIVSYRLRAGSEIERLAVLDMASTTAVNLTGNEFAQTVVGNAGSNTINGGGGSDTLMGGGGADRFVFNTPLGASNVDRIVDFTRGTDVVMLDDAIFTGLAPGALPSAAFAVGAAAADGLDRIIYNPSNGALLYDADGNGSAIAAVRFATLQPGLSNMSAASFVVF